MKKQVLCVLILLLILMCETSFAEGQQENSTGITWDLAETGDDYSGTEGTDGYYQNGVSWEDSTRFEAVNNEVMIDHLTGLMWLREPDAISRTWNLSIDRARSYNQWGFSDWRLPNVREMRTLYHHGRYTTMWLKEIGFTNIEDDEYWTSTSFYKDTGKAWHMDLRTGRTYIEPKTELKLMMMVR